MKITIISHYPPIEGGISKYTERTVDLLRKENVEVFVVPIDSFLDSIKLLTKLLKSNPDIVRLEFTISMYRLSITSILIQLYLLRLIKKTTLAVNFHEVTRDIDALGKIAIVLYKLMKPLFKYVSVHTQGAKNVLINKCDYDDKKVKVIPLGLYIQPFQTKNNKINKLKRDNKKVILFFGYIHIHKGIEYLLDAYRLLIVENPNYKKTTKLVIAGTVRKRKGIFKIFESFDNKYYESLLNKARLLGIEDFTYFSGFVKEDEINFLIKNAFIIVLPYTATEQSGVLNQVLPYRKPIVASNIGGIGETLKSAGILVNPADSIQIKNAIYLLLNNREYYSNVKKAYSELVKLLNPKKIIKMNIAFYEHQ